MLGDHNLWAKITYYQPSVGIPLVITGPDVVAGRTFDGPVNLHDLAATFLEVAGIASTPEMDSRSLVPVLAGTSDSHRDYVLSGLVLPKGAWHLVFDGRYKLVNIEGEPPILFDLQEDPWEDQNIAEAEPDTVAQLQAWLDAELNQAA